MTLFSFSVYLRLRILILQYFYVMFYSLFVFSSEGNLLKEAVRRLQLGLSPKIQRNFYDSDDDCRTPPPPPAPAPTSFPHSDLCEVGIN